MRIDSHHHVWDLTVREQGWMVGESLDTIRKNFSMSDLREQSAGTGIEKTVLVQTVMLYEETPEFLQLALEDDFIAGVVGWLKIDSPDAISHLDSYQDLPGNEYLVGIRDFADDFSNPDYLAQPQVIKNVKELGRRGYTFDMLSKIPQMKSATELVKSAPNTQFIINHISNPVIADQIMEPWTELIKILANLPNTVCKVSGMISQAKWESWKTQDFRPYMDVLLNYFGPSRLMFGSDWPVVLLGGSYKQAITLAEELTDSLSEAEKNEFWAGTVNRSYGLDLDI